jgi:putative ATP-binding cassette transporter
LLGAFSLIVTQFQSISSFAAVVARLGSLAEGIERAYAVTVLSREACGHGIRTLDCPICLAHAAELPALPTIMTREEDGRVAYEHLTLQLPPDGRIGVRALTVSIATGTRTLVLGPDEPAKAALLWATVGVWDHGEGRIIRPGPGRMMVLPERPYLPAGTLREMLVPAGTDSVASDERVMNVLRELHLEVAVARAGGLDVEQAWDTLLSLGEQQLVSAARLVLAAPAFAFLHRIGTTLSAEQVDDLLRTLVEHRITYVTFDHGTRLRDRHDAVLELAADGGWTWTKTAAAGPDEPSTRRRADAEIAE